MHPGHSPDLMKSMLSCIHVSMGKESGFIAFTDSVLVISGMTTQPPKERDSFH